MRKTDFEKMLGDITNIDYKLLIIREFSRDMTRESVTESEYDKWNALCNAVAEIHEKMWYLDNWITEYGEG